MYDALGCVKLTAAQLFTAEKQTKKEELHAKKKKQKKHESKAAGHQQCGTQTLNIGTNCKKHFNKYDLLYNEQQCIRNKKLL